jgi:hypothetical protein
MFQRAFKHRLCEDANEQLLQELVKKVPHIPSHGVEQLSSTDCIKLLDTDSNGLLLMSNDLFIGDQEIQDSITELVRMVMLESIGSTDNEKR